jgi:K+-sensing histidine kinase KdpD
LLESFYTTKPGGLGVGLSICRSIIEAHGGRLWASANEPQGAVFQFTLTRNRHIKREARTMVIREEIVHAIITGCLHPRTL